MKYLNEKQLSEINLPKWPGCDVDGSPVTREQAMEILARTFGGYFLINDREFENQVKEIYYTAGSFDGIPKRGKWWDDSSMVKEGESEEERRDRLHKSWNFQSAYQGEMGLLSLEYLNNQRVCSSYIGGPYGWCDWSGRIYQFMLPGAERGVSLSVWREACRLAAGRKSRHFEGSRSGVPIEFISIGLPPLV